MYRSKNDNDAINKYINSYIKLKVKSHKEEYIEAILEYNKYRVYRNLNNFKLKFENENINQQLSNFSNKLTDIWNTNIDRIITIMNTNNCSCDYKLEKAQEVHDELSQLCLQSGTMSLKLLNLINFNSSVGFLFNIDGIDELQGKKGIKKETFTKTFNEMLQKKENNKTMYVNSKVNFNNKSNILNSPINISKISNLNKTANNDNKYDKELM
jgi:hypothetical protein